MLFVIKMGGSILKEGASSDLVSDLNEEIDQVAGLMQAELYPTKNPEDAAARAKIVSEKIKDHMLRVHHIVESKKLSVHELVQGLLRELDKGHFRTKKGIQ